jgi:hypothetical protein
MNARPPPDGPEGRIGQDRSEGTTRFAFDPANWSATLVSRRAGRIRQSVTAARRERREAPAAMRTDFGKTNPPPFTAAFASVRQHLRSVALGAVKRPV